MDLMVPSAEVKIIPTAQLKGPEAFEFEVVFNSFSALLSCMTCCQLNI